jgi:thiamine transport system permease protein
VDGDRAAVRTWRLATIAIPLAFLAVFFVYPVVTILGRGLWPNGHVDLSPVTDVFRDESLRGIAWFTLWQAALSTVLTVAVALPAAYVVSRVRFRGRALVRALVTVPFVLPTVVVGSAFRALGFEGSLGAILIAHVFFNYAVVVRVVGGLWSHLDPREEDAARVLGASRLRTFFSVTLPSLRPAILSAASIVFLFTFTSFGVILILGGETRATLETEIYTRTSELLDLRTAAGLTIVQLLAVVALLTVTARLEGGRAVALRLRAAVDTLRRPRTPGERLFLAGTLASMGLVLGVPIGVLVYRSFDTPDGFGLGSYRALGTLRAGSVLFVPPTDAIRNSLLYALAATAIAVVIGGLASVAVARSHTSVLDTALALPLGVSAVTVGFGFLIALDEPPLDLRSSWILVPIAQALVAIPFVVRIAVPVLRSIDPRLREAAAVLGAAPRRVWKEVDLPVARRVFLVGAGFAFAISLGEFGATAFASLAQPERPTLPVEIYRLLGQPGAANFGAAMAASVILMVLTTVAVLSIERFRSGDATAF